MRELDKNEALFLLRVKKTSSVFYLKEEKSYKQGELANKLSLGKLVKTIKYQKQKVTIYVNSCEIEIRRDATKMTISKDGKRKYAKIEGKAVKARFVVERLVDEENNVVAEWLLVTNILDTKVSAQTLATWYYYRWKIESYFKLLKSSGFNLEEWQQKEPIALFKRLLVVSLSCLLVWKLANDSSHNAKEIRDFLVLLSGRLIEKGKEFTLPALLAGLESYLQMMDVMLLFSHEELLDMHKNLTDLLDFDF
jgi:IS4 transposase